MRKSERIRKRKIDQGKWEKGKEILIRKSDTKKQEGYTLFEYVIF